MVIPKMNKARAERVMGRVGYASCLCSPEGLSSFLRCMYMFVCMYVHIYVCIGMHAYALYACGGQRFTSGV